MTIQTTIDIGKKSLAAVADHLSRTVCSSYSDHAVEFAGLRHNELVQALIGSKNFEKFVKTQVRQYGESFLQCTEDYVDQLLPADNLEPLVDKIPELKPLISWLDQCENIFSDAFMSQYLENRSQSCRFVGVR